MRGVVPAGMLLTLWAGAISACFYGIVVHPELMSRKEGGRSESLLQNSAPARPATTAAAPTAEDVSYRHQVVPIGAAFVFNACVTVAVNMAYIYSTQQALGASVHFCIQLSLSIFRLVYVAVVFPLLSRPIRSVIENVRFRFMLLTINNLFLPCMVTALTSDACFQVLWHWSLYSVPIITVAHTLCCLIILPVLLCDLVLILNVICMHAGTAHSSRHRQHPLFLSHVCSIHNYPKYGDVLFSV